MAKVTPPDTKTKEKPHSRDFYQSENLHEPVEPRRAMNVPAEQHAKAVKATFRPNPQYTPPSNDPNVENPFPNPRIKK